MPSWETNIKLTFVDQYYYTEDLLSDSLHFEVIDGKMCFITEGEIDGQEVVAEDLAINPPEIITPSELLLSGMPSISIRVPLTNSEMQLVEATIATGQIHLTFLNLQPPLPALQGESVSIEIEGLENSQGQNITRTYSSTQILAQPDRVIPLDGYSFRAPPEGLPYLTHITFKISTSQNHSIAQPMCGLQVHFYEDIYFRDIFGKVNVLAIKADSSSVDIDLDYPINVEYAIRLQEPRIDFTFDNKIGFDFQIETFARTTNDRNQNANNPLVRNDILGEDKRILRSGVRDITFDDGIDTLLEIAPNKVEFYDTVYRIAPNQADGRVAVGQTIQGKYKVVIPFNFNFDAEVTVYPHPNHIQTLEPGKSFRENIEKLSQDFTFDVFFWNNFDATVIVNLFLASDPQLLFSDTPDDYAHYTSEELYARERHDDNFTRVVLSGIRLVGGQESNYPIPDHREFFDEGRRDIFYKWEKVYFDFTFSFEDAEPVVKPKDHLRVIAGLSTRILIDPEEFN